MSISIAMARGTIVLDENLFNLEDALKEMNIRVRKVRPGTKDDEILKSDLLANRIFVTNNSKDFVGDAPKLDMGIIATENIDSKDKVLLANMISNVLSNMSLWSKRHGFIVRLKSDGKHHYEELTQ